MRMDVVTIGLLAALGGVGFTIAGYEILGEDGSNDQTMVEQSKISQNLTEPALIKDICSVEYINEKGDALCRELFCRMTTRGVEAKTSGQECEEISNINNTMTLMKVCEAKTDKREKSDCYRVFRERK